MVRYLSLVGILFFGMFMLASYNQAHAGFFDDVRTIIGGHIDDAKSRFTDDQVLTDVKVLKSGDIDTEARGQDFVHSASGTINIVEKDGKRYVQLAPNFTSTPGPDYHVYVSFKRDIKHEDDFSHSEQVELGRLIKGTGASYYEIPEGALVNSVTIWCKAFGEYIGSANVEHVN